MKLDKFYTKREVAEKCINLLKNHVIFSNFDIILEPSAGEGSFYLLLPEDNRKGIDIDPGIENIIKQDFFNYEPEKNKKYMVIGNPPFGKSCSLAIKFFNKAAEFSDFICFILPRTFKRESVKEKLDDNFHLLFSHDLPLKPCCFYPDLAAKCCFQIWERRECKRKKKIFKQTRDFIFLKHGPKDNRNQPTPPENADFAIKAYGSNCGEIREENLEILRPKSWHWIKSNIDETLLRQRLRSLDFSISKDTVRQESIGQKELVDLYSTKYDV